MTSAGDAPSTPAWTGTELKAEMLGTFVVILGGCSVSASAQRREIDIGTGDHHAMALYCNLGWAVSVALGVLVSFDASGAHLNPAVTLSAMIHDGFNVGKGLRFIAMHFIGAFLAASLSCMIFTGFHDHDKYATNFYHTGPSPGTDIGQAFLVEIVGTVVLMIGIKFLATGGPPTPNKGVMAFGVGAIIFFIGMNLGYLTGYSLNPARELSPRFVRFLDSVLRGHGATGTFDNLDFLAPTIGPLIGAPLGVVVYKCCRSEDNPPSVEQKLEEGAATVCCQGPDVGTMSLTANSCT